MKLTLAEPKYFKEPVSIISDLVNEARFSITKDGIELIAMDPANVAMVVYKLLSSTFVEYDIKEDKTIAINLANLKQILRRASSNDALSMDIVENKMVIKLKGRTTRTFSLPLLDLDEKEQKMPSLEFPVKIEVSSSELTSAVEDADIVAESVNLIAEQEKFTVQAEGDLNQAKVEIKADDNTKIQITGSEKKIVAKYSIEYLKKMISGSKVADTAVLQFNKDYPLKLSFTAVDKASLAFILAPRVENE
jgi:proliferating cell nuclear antigen